MQIRYSNDTSFNYIQFAEKGFLIVNIILGLYMENIWRAV